VNAGDALQCKASSGRPAGADNFRADVNGDGTINAGDSLLIKSRSGTSL
jgi:hypothetical protein